MTVYMENDTTKTFWYMRRLNWDPVFENVVVLVMKGSVAGTSHKVLLLRFDSDAGADDYVRKSQSKLARKGFNVRSLPSTKMVFDRPKRRPSSRKKGGMTSSSVSCVDSEDVRMFNLRAEVDDD